jgi:CheY-like chemotaxis protein
MPTILIVDDETSMCTVLSNLLERHAYTTLTAENGKQAIEVIKRNQVKLVLLDVHLPDIDGVEVLRKIKKIDKNIPVIMCSGFDDVDFAVESMKFGAFDYVRKPFDNEEVIDKIEKALRKGKIEVPVFKKTTLTEKIKLKEIVKPVWVYPVAFILTGLGISLILTEFVLSDKGKWTIYKTPYANPTSIAWGKNSDNQYLWVSDWAEQNIWKHSIDTSLSVAEVYHFPKNWPGGLAIGDGHIWSSDAVADRIYMHICDKNLTITADYKSPGPNPTALCWDGTFLWSCDADKKKIYKHKLDDNLSIVGVYNSPGSYPVGIFWDEENIWSADADTNKIYKHHMDGFLSVSHEYQPEAFVNRENKISGFAWDGENIWFLLEGTNKICKYNI